LTIALGGELLIDQPIAALEELWRRALPRYLDRPLTSAAD
jgi:hypothetical protein